MNILDWLKRELFIGTKIKREAIKKQVAQLPAKTEFICLIGAYTTRNIEDIAKISVDNGRTIGDLCLLYLSEGRIHVIDLQRGTSKLDVAVVECKIRIKNSGIIVIRTETSRHQIYKVYGFKLYMDTEPPQALPLPDLVSDKNSKMLFNRLLEAGCNEFI